MSIDIPAVSQRIQMVMRQLKLNQVEFAKKLQVTQPAISKYLQGRIPPAPVLLQLANLGGVTMEWILTGASNYEGAQNYIAEPAQTYGQTQSLQEKINRMPVPLQQALINLVDTIAIHQE